MDLATAIPEGDDERSKDTQSISMQFGQQDLVEGERMAAQGIGQVFRGPRRHELAAPQIGVVCCQVVGRALVELARLDRRQRGLQRFRNGQGNLVLDREQVGRGQLPVRSKDRARS